MTFHQHLFIGVCIAAMAGCASSPTQPVSDNSKKVNRKLRVEDSLGRLNTIEGMHAYIRLHRSKNQVDAVKADLLTASYKVTRLYVEKLKEGAGAYHKMPKDSLRLPSNLFFAPSVADTLTPYIKLVAQYAYAATTNEQKKRTLDSVFVMVGIARKESQWVKGYFKKAPLISTFTMLNEVEEECTGATSLVLEDIKQRLVK